VSGQQPEPGGDLVIRVPAASAAATAPAAPQDADETQNADEEQADGVD